MRRFPRYASALLLLAWAGNAHALNQTSSLTVPLIDPYPLCGADTDTSGTCPSAQDDLRSPWTFSQGTLKIESNQISLRLDDIQLRPSFQLFGMEPVAPAETCPTSGACRCWNSTSSDDNCTDTSNCSSPNNHCGPNGNNTADNNWATVVLYLQNYVPNSFTNGTNVVRCTQTYSFDLVASGTSNQNRQVNQSVSTAVAGACGFGYKGGRAEIRRVEVLDGQGNVVAVPTGIQ